MTGAVGQGNVPCSSTFDGGTVYTIKRSAIRFNTLGLSSNNGELLLTRLSGTLTAPDIHTRLLQPIADINNDQAVYNAIANDTIDEFGVMTEISTDLYSRQGIAVVGLTKFDIGILTNEFDKDGTVPQNGVFGNFEDFGVDGPVLQFGSILNSERQHRGIARGCWRGHQ